MLTRSIEQQQQQQQQQRRTVQLQNSAADSRAGLQALRYVIKKTKPIKVQTAK